MLHNDSSDLLQVIVTTSKIHKLSQQIKNEKTVNERMKTLHSCELQQLSAEAKRSALEISKLKVTSTAHLNTMVNLLLLYVVSLC